MYPLLVIGHFGGDAAVAPEGHHATPHSSAEATMQATGVPIERMG